MIIDGITDEEWNDHVMAGEAFSGMTIVSAVGGLSSELQLLNPPSSGVRVRLRCMEPMQFFAQAINGNIRRHDPPLANLGGLFGAGSPQNLLSSGPASVAEFRYENPAAQNGSPFWLILTDGTTRIDYPAFHQDWGHELLESEGIVWSGALARTLIVGWQWAEVAL